MWGEGRGVLLLLLVRCEIEVGDLEDEVVRDFTFLGCPSEWLEVALAGDAVALLDDIELCSVLILLPCLHVEEC